MAKLPLHRESCMYQPRKLGVQAQLSTHINGSNEFEWHQEGVDKECNLPFYILFILWMVSGVRGDVAETPHSFVVPQTVHFHPTPLSTGAYSIIPFLLFFFPPSPHSSFSSLFLLILYPHFLLYPISAYFPYLYPYFFSPLYLLKQASQNTYECIYPYKL